MELEVPLFGKNEEYPPLLLYVFDEDLTGDDFIGYLSIDISEALKSGYALMNTTEIAQPQWKKIRYGINNIISVFL